MRKRLPLVDRLALRIIAREVAIGHRRGRIGCQIAEILALQRVRVIFQMVEHEQVAVAVVQHQARSAGRRIRQNPQRRMPLKVLVANPAPARHGRRERIREAAQQRHLGRAHRLREHAGQLAGEVLLVDAVPRVQRRQRPPADAEAAEDVGLGPLVDVHELGPVGHVMVGHGLHRGSRDDHGVVPLRPHFIERPVERLKVLDRGVPGRVAGRRQQRKLHLKRRMAQQPGNLHLGCDLGRHQVEQQNPQRADVLPESNAFRDQFHAFAAQNGLSRGTIGNLDRHGTDQCYEREKLMERHCTVRRAGRKSQPLVSSQALSRGCPPLLPGPAPIR